VGEYAYRSGQRVLDAGELELLRESGWDLGLEHYIDAGDRMTSRMVYQKDRPDGVRPPYRVLAYWDREGAEPELVVRSLGYEEAFGLLLDDMVARGLEG